MGRVKQPKKEINPNLILDFESANFKNTSVKNSALKLISKFMQTGDYKYLRWLASDPLIYREEIFWDQISRWKQLASPMKYKDPQTAKWKEYKNPQAAKCLKAVVLGFNKYIKPPKKRPGRSRKSIIINKAKYLAIKQKLNRAGLGNYKLRRPKELQQDKSKHRDGRNLQGEILSYRTKCLLHFCEREKIKLTQDEIKKLVWATSSEIARYLTAKQESTSPITIKRRLAEEEKKRKQEQIIQKARLIWSKRKNTP